MGVAIEEISKKIKPFLPHLTQHPAYSFVHKIVGMVQ